MLCQGLLSRDSNTLHFFLIRKDSGFSFADHTQRYQDPWPILCIKSSCLIVLRREESTQHVEKEFVRWTEQPAQATGPKHCCTDLVPAPGPCGPPESLENPTIVCLKHTCMLKEKNMTCPAEKELLPSINKGPRISQQVDFQRTQLFVPPTEVETGLKKITNIRNNSLRLHVLNFPIHFHDSPTFSLRKRSQERDKSILSLVAPNFTPLCFDVVFHDCSSQF